jgi:hypothetical protein
LRLPPLIVAAARRAATPQPGWTAPGANLKVALRRPGAGNVPVPRKPRRPRFQRVGFSLNLAALRVVQSGKQLALFNALARPDQQFRDRRRLGRLDQLNLARRNDLALAGRDFVNLGQRSPQQENCKAGRDRDDDQPRSGQRFAALV